LYCSTLKPDIRCSLSLSHRPSFFLPLSLLTLQIFLGVLTRDDLFLQFSVPQQFCMYPRPRRKKNRWKQTFSCFVYPLFHDSICHHSLYLSLLLFSCFILL
jgi:hypothetical protein